MLKLLTHLPPAIAMLLLVALAVASNQRTLSASPGWSPEQPTPSIRNAAAQTTEITSAAVIVCRHSTVLPCNAPE